jgi:hypothetical protein
MAKKPDEYSDKEASALWSTVSWLANSLPTIL